jgi:hypothetical protein
MIRQIELPTVTLAGDVGAAAGTAVSYAPIAGEVMGVHVAYTGGTTTENLVVSTVDGAQTVLQLYANQTSGWHYPRVQTCSFGGTALEYGTNFAQTAPLPVCDYVQAVVSSGGTAGNTVAVSLLIEG